MKARKGYRVISHDGTAWDGDCAKWAADARRMGLKVLPLRIYGEKAWDCSACEMGLRH